jgi:hypothetical protein
MSVTAELGETLVDQGNCHGAFAERSRAAFDGSASDVARSEQPGQIRFKR